MGPAFMSHSTDILIIGAGVTGLAAAYTLRHTDLDMTILEARDRIGGRTLSIRTKNGALYSGEQTARKILTDAGNQAGNRLLSDGVFPLDTCEPFGVEKTRKRQVLPSIY